MDHFRYIKIHTWLQTKEMYHSFLSLKMISFDFDDFFQASQPSTVKPRLTATSVIRPLFWPPGKNRDKFSSPKKKTLVNTVTSLKRPNFFGPLVTVSTAFHCMNISIYIYIYIGIGLSRRKKTTHRASNVYAYTKTWRRLPFLREKATGYYFRKGDYWSFD